MMSLEEDDVFPDHLDPEMRCKLRNSDLQQGGFRFGRAIQPDVSLMYFVKKRARPSFEGFVDVITLAPVNLPQNRGVKMLNIALNPPVPAESSAVVRDDISSQLQYLSHAKHGATARQLLQTNTLPLHDYSRNLTALADCLLADNDSVRRDSSTRLERLLIVTPYSELTAARTQLLNVVEVTQHFISEPIVDPQPGLCQHLHLCGHLNLVAMSALLCRKQNHPSFEDCRLAYGYPSPVSLLSWPKVARGKMSKVEEERQEVLKVIHAFYDQVEKHLKEYDKSKSILPVCRDKKFPKVSFFQQMTTFFLLLNQLALEERDDQGQELLKEIGELYDLLNTAKRMKPEAKVGIDSLLIRSLVIILNTTFAKVRQQVGEGRYNVQEKTARLLALVVGKASQDHLKKLLPHISTAAFHESDDVGSIVTELLESCGHNPLSFTVDHLQASLGVADFRVDHPPSDTKGACSWHNFQGRFAQELAQCSVFVHAGTCQAKRSWLSDCLMYANWIDLGEWQRYRQTLDMLVMLSPHAHIIKLLAFQMAPFYFYATEHIEGRRLLEHLINQRAAQRWLSTSTLCRIVHQVIEGLDFLASKNIASRDITAYDILVAGRSRRGGCAGEKTDVLMSEEFTIKLANLGLAHQFRVENSRSFIPDQGPIPLLWTPPEALLKNEYSEQSMVYSLGCVMYELWTHGCQPFTSYQKSTSDTVRMMLLMPDTVPLIRWPCIPDDVYDIMKVCTSSNPASRRGLKALKQSFMDIHARFISAAESTGLQLGGTMEQTYPSFCDDQLRRKHVPERGIPPDIMQIIEEHKKTQGDAYRNMRASRWVHYADQSHSTLARELISPYWIEFAYLEECTSVRERLSARFVKEGLPALMKCAAQAHSQIAGVTTWMKEENEETKLVECSSEPNVHERRYRPSWTLQDTACMGLLATSESGYVAMAMERHVHVLLSLSRAVHELHASGWLHRDIRASSILVDCKTGEVILARVGRMCQANSPSGFVLDEPFEDTWRWLAPEVLSEGKYGRENDVFMLGTVFWEVFWCRQIAERNPTATELSYVPFADRDKGQIPGLLRQKESLPKPASCPDWLYKLSANCRHYDPAQRPSTQDLITTLQLQYGSKIDPDRTFLPHPKLLALAEMIIKQTAESGPELPARFQTKHARPFRDEAEATTQGTSSTATVNLQSIKFSLIGGKPKDAAYASNVNKKNNVNEYLTPSAEHLTTNHEQPGRQQFHLSEKRPLRTPIVAAGAALPNSQPRKGMSVSEAALALNCLANRPDLERIPEVTRHSLTASRSFPLSAADTVDDEHVYSEIRDMVLTARSPKK